MTCEANSDRNVASSRAESPPPTTAIGRPRKKYPSQVAHVETPCPISFRSDGSPSKRAEAPVAIISESPEYDADEVATVNGGRRISTFVTTPATISVQTALPGSIATIKSGPMMPSRNPGKLSTAVVSMSCRGIEPFNDESEEIGTGPHKRLR